MLKWKSIYGFWKKGAVKSHSSNFKYPLQLFSCGEGLFFQGQAVVLANFVDTWKCA